jgi:outer membrane biosynthesis protein TonB
VKEQTNIMAKANSVDLSLLVLLALMEAENYTLSAKDIMARTGAKGQEVKPVVEGLESQDPPFVGRDENDRSIFFLTQEGLDYAVANNPDGGTEEAADDEFEEETPAPKPAARPAAAKPAATKSATPKAAAAKTQTAAPKAAAAKPAAASAAKPAAAAKPKAVKAQTQEVEDEDEGFTMSYETLDKMSQEDVLDRLRIWQEAAEANFGDGSDYDRAIVAEGLSRIVAKVRKFARNKGFIE